MKMSVNSKRAENISLSINPVLEDLLEALKYVLEVTI